MIELDVILEDTDSDVNVEKYFSEADYSENRYFVKGFAWGVLMPIPLLVACLVLLKTVV